MHNLERGKSVLQQMTDENKKSVQIQNSLIDFFGDCGQMDDALNVFNRMSATDRDIVSIGALMKAFIHNEANSDALSLYEGIPQSERNGVVFSLALKACSKANDFERGKAIHSDLICSDFGSKYVWTALIDFYGNFGDVESAQNVFESVADGDKDVSIVNAMLTAYLNNGLHQNLVRLYDESAIKNDITHNIALKACANLCDIERGERIHCELRTKKRVDIQTKNSLIGFYGNCSNITAAWNVFDCIAEHEKDVSTMNAMMNAYRDNAFYDEAMNLYKSMGQKDVISHNTAIQCCGYAKNVDEAQNIFDSMDESERDIVSMNMMMQVLVHNDRSRDAMAIYEQIGELQRDEMSHNLALKALTKMNEFEAGMKIIEAVQNENGQTMDIALKHRLIDFYAHFEDVKTAKKIFDSISESEKNIASFNVMMNAFCVNQMNAECLALFEQIKNCEHLEADTTSFQNALQAAANDNLYGFGQQIFEQMAERKGKEGSDISIVMNLIHLYGKCGYLDKCSELFAEIKRNQSEVYKHEISIWNAMIHAFGRNGKLEEVKALFEELQTETDLFADRQTFIDILSAYGHCDGDDNVEEAKAIWNDIENLFAKYDCIVISTFVDCLSRKNHLNEAYDVIIDFETKTEQKYHAMWLALLSGCRKFKKQMLGEKVYKEMSNRFNKKDHCMMHANILLNHLNLSSSSSSD